MKILVTGGNGFLGSNVVRKLLSEGHELFVISNNCNNILDILPQLIYNTRYTNAIDEFQPDVVIHFGWKGGNNAKDVHHINQFYDNMPMSLDLLSRLVLLPQKPKFIGVGSFAEYGDYNFPIKEEYFEKPQTLYGVSKLSLKNYSELICTQNGMEWSWIRPCYIYGPGDVSTRLIPTTINKCINNQPIELDACNKIIDYLYIDDFCKYVSYLATNKSTGVYNLSSGYKYHLQEVIKTIHQLVGNNNSISFTEEQDLQKWVCGDNSKIVQESGQTPSNDFLTGMIKTINFYKNETFNNN
jgi:nucleoside-diphosphate-sugar epimerase